MELTRDVPASPPVPVHAGFQPTDAIQLAWAIYVHAVALTVAKSGWDFDPIAESAWNAAESFNRVTIRRGASHG